MCESYLRAISGEGTVVWQLKSLETSVETGPRSRVQFFRSFWNSTTFQTVPKVVFYDIYVIIYYVWIIKFYKILYVIYLFIISSCIYISQSLQWANTIYIYIYTYIYILYTSIYTYIIIYMRNNLIIIYYEFRRRLITLICLFLVKSILWYYAYVNAERRVTPAHRQALYKRRRSGARRAWN